VVNRSPFSSKAPAATHGDVLLSEDNDDTHGVDNDNESDDDDNDDDDIGCV